MKKYNKKLTGMILCAAMAANVLAGCGAPGDAGQSSQESGAATEAQQASSRLVTSSCQLRTGALEEPSLHISQSIREEARGIT